MASKIALFLLGLAVGAVVCAAILSKKAHTETTAALAATTSSFTNQIAELQSTLTATKARLDSVREDNGRLAARVQELMKEETATPTVAEKPAKKSGLAALFGGDGTNGFSEAMSGMMKAAIEQQIEGKMSAMKTKLNLTPEQDAAVRDIMGRQMSKGTELAQKMLTGDLTKEEMEKIGKEPSSEGDQIKALLTPEQIAAYDEFEKEEKTRMTRLVANSELLQMQSSLQLNEEQQDKVFAVLAEQAESQFDPQKANSGGFDFRKQSEQKAEALRSVLTPEQFERYQKFQEQQLKLIESFMPKGASNANVRVAPIISQ